MVITILMMTMFHLLLIMTLKMMSFSAAQTAVFEKKKSRKSNTELDQPDEEGEF